MASGTGMAEALTIASMEYHYFKDAASATQLFSFDSYGLHFKYSDIGAASYKSLPKLVEAVSAFLMPEELALLNGRLVKQDAWHIQSGVGGMILHAGADNDAMIGGANADGLWGGGGTDILIGGANNDVLVGEAGNDYLLGGIGFDTYLINAGDGYDTLLDSDDSGVVKLSTLEAKGSTAMTDPAKWLQFGADIWIDQVNGITYTKSVVDGETPLLIHKGDSNILVKGWSDGELGIVLGAGSAPVFASPAATLVGDFRKAIDTHGTPETGDDTYIMTAGNYTPDGDEANALDLISGTSGNDVIAGLGGDDSLSGMAGDDTLYGGAGSDHIQGGLGKDTINGGAGDDAIFGSSDMAIDKPSSVNFNQPTNNYLYPQATGFNWTSGYNAAFANGVPDSYSNAARNRLDGDQGSLIDGGAGNDFIAAGTGADYVQGGTGKDWIWGMDQDDVLLGDGDNDWIHGDGNQPVGNSIVWALPGNHGNDIIDGGDGNDMVVGGVANESTWKEAA